MQKIGIITGAFFMLTAVMLGAFGAHGLKELISIEDIAIFKIGVFYQFVHALSILILVILAKIYSIERYKYSMYFFSLGILFFSGSLYLLATKSLTGLNATFIGPITPLGGLMFIIAWVLVIVFSLRSKNF